MVQVLSESVGSPAIVVIPLSQFARCVYVWPPHVTTVSPLASFIKVAIVAPLGSLMVALGPVSPYVPSSEKQVLPFLLNVALNALDSVPASVNEMTTFTPFE